MTDTTPATSEHLSLSWQQIEMYQQNTGPITPDKKHIPIAPPWALL
jgi:hypothetical protein